MIFVFDTSCFKILKNFYPSRFPSVWSKFDELAGAKRVISVREVLKELEAYNDTDFIQDWAKANHRVFLTPGDDELLFVGEIFKIPHFQTLIS